MEIYGIGEFCFFLFLSLHIHSIIHEKKVLIHLMNKNTHSEIFQATSEGDLRGKIKENPESCRKW